MRFWPTAFAVLLCVSPLAAAPDERIALPALLGALDAAVVAAKAGAGAATVLTDLHNAVGLAPVQVPPLLTASHRFPIAPALVVEHGELQIALTQLAILEGANDQIKVLRAQNGAGDAILIRSGFGTLADVAAAVAAQGLAGMTQQAGRWQLTRPLVIWEGAGLRLQPGETLEMNTQTGAFLISFGQLHIAKAQVSASSGNNLGNAGFKPFVLVVGQGTLTAQGATFRGLGMAGTSFFSGVAVSSQGLFPPEFPPAITTSRFDDVAQLMLSGTDGGLIAQNTFINARSGAITLSGTTNSRISANSIIAAQGGPAIRVVNAAKTTVVDGNLVVAAGQNGMQIGGNSSDLQILGNAVLDSLGSGIAVQRTSCVAMIGNTIARSGGTGLRLNEVGHMAGIANIIVLNQGAGVAVNGQLRNHPVKFVKNLLIGNRVGFDGAAIGAVQLAANDLDAQLPRLFGGEFSQHLPAFLTASEQQGAALFQIAAPATGIEKVAYENFSLAKAAEKTPVPPQTPTVTVSTACAKDQN